MQVEGATIVMDKEQALAKLDEYTKAQRIKQTKDQQLLRRLYKALAEGKKVLDIFELFKQPGVLLDTQEPRVAVARVNWARVEFNRGWQSDGSATFRQATANWRARGQPRFEVHLPPGTFPAPGQNVRHGIQTLVPVVPLEKQPPNPDTQEYPYYVLFEVEKWEPRAPRDPYLLRRVTPNLFVMETKWATTKLERAFINGRLAAAR